MNVQRVDIFNRRGKWGTRTQKVEVRISDQLPSSSEEKFSGGTLLGNFEGTGANPQHIVVSGEEETDKKNHFFYFASFFYLPARVLKGVSQAKRRLEDMSSSRLTKVPPFSTSRR